MSSDDIEEMTWDRVLAEREYERQARALEKTHGEFTCCITVTGYADDIESFRETVKNLGYMDDYTVKFISGPELNSI